MTLPLVVLRLLEGGKKPNRTRENEPIEPSTSRPFPEFRSHLALPATCWSPKRRRAGSVPAGGALDGDCVVLTNRADLNRAVHALQTNSHLVVLLSSAVKLFGTTEHGQAD